MEPSLEIVNKSGAWFTYEGERLGQGREAAKSFLTANPDLMEEIDHKVRVACGLVFDEDSEVGSPVASVLRRDAIWSMNAPVPPAQVPFMRCSMPLSK